MTPDLGQLSELVRAVPGYEPRPAGRATEAMVRAAEARLGPLPPSYRWWLTEFGGVRLLGTEWATVWPEEAHDAYEALTAPWRREGRRLWFAHEPDCGDAFGFVLDQERAGGEWPVVCREGTSGEEHPLAESFAGFLTVRTARALGLGDGPQPALARLWRSTPGVRLDGGLLVYGPHQFVARNREHQVARRAPHWVLVGEEGPGAGLFMRRHGRDRSSVLRCALDGVAPDVETVGERVTGDLLGWLSRGVRPAR
ncbi:SMI1/KNR4 family protein [Streptomyces sp. LE64]|uniref:SMI1/KNR4 family protein n=1 Tax=Streptomyces sp. LE64 TaxID=3448653 RepID=UPI00404180A5